MTLFSLLISFYSDAPTILPFTLKIVLQSHISSSREQVKVHLRRAAGSGQELNPFGAQAQDQISGGTTQLGSAYPASLPWI